MFIFYNLVNFFDLNQQNNKKKERPKSKQYIKNKINQYLC